jgi:hypothetical protein
MFQHLGNMAVIVSIVGVKTQHLISRSHVIDITSLTLGIDLKMQSVVRATRWKAGVRVARGQRFASAC